MRGSARRRMGAAARDIPDITRVQQHRHRPGHPCRRDALVNAVASPRTCLGDELSPSTRAAVSNQGKQSTRPSSPGDQPANCLASSQHRPIVNRAQLPQPKFNIMFRRSMAVLCQIFPAAGRDSHYLIVTGRWMLQRRPRRSRSPSMHIARGSTCG